MADLHIEQHVEELKDIEQIIKELREKEYNKIEKKIERKIVDTLKSLLIRRSHIPERFEECTRIIDQLDLQDSLNVIFERDNLELYLYVKETYNFVLTEQHFRLAAALFNEHVFTSLNKAVVLFNEHIFTLFHSKGRILTFMLETHPELLTYEIIDELIEKKYIPLIQKARQILPGFYPTLDIRFNEICSAHIQHHFPGRDDFPSRDVKILSYLIEEGFRPEYYSTEFNRVNSKSFKQDGFIVDWNDLPDEQFTVTHVDTQSKVIYTHRDAQRIVDRMVLIEGNQENVITIKDWVEEGYFNIMSQIRVYKHILTNPIFAPLQDVPSLKTIAMNIMGANGVSTKKIPSELFQINF